MAQFILNLFIALLWVLLVDEDTFYVTTFIKGYIIGLVIVLFLDRFFGGKFYLYKLWLLFKLVMLFNYELLVSSVAILQNIMFKSKTIDPGIVYYKTSLEQKWQVAILVMLIILTPGSVVLRISNDNTVLTIHALNHTAAEKEKLLKSIKQFEDLLTEVKNA